MQPCIYVSSTWGIHDQRWQAALQSLDFDVEVRCISLEIDDVQELRQQFESHISSDVPVLAGPLDAITKALVGIPQRLVGLSWGFDMYRMDDLAWLSQLDALILDSTETMDVARNVGVSETALTLLPWGVDVTVFTPDGAVADTTSWDLRDGANVILSLRAHEPLYRVADILEAFSVIAGDDPNVVLIIGNTGSLTTELERQAERLGVLEQVRFIGSLDEDDLPALLRRADAYVSASEVDGSSVTLLQAMACGTPVVVSDTPGNLSWVTDGETGFTFPVGDPHSLASALARATGQPHPSVRRSAITRVRHDADWVANLQRLKSAMLGL